jgi:hypothetical protein
VEACTCELENIFGCSTNHCSSASWIILIALT